METFKGFAVNVVDSIVEYIRDKSYLDTLDLSVGEVEYDVSSASYNEDFKIISYKCRIYNNLLNTNNSILVSVSLWGDDYIVDIFSAYYHNFGISSLIGTFSVKPTSDFSADVEARYIVQLDTSSNIDIITDSFSGNLTVQDSSFISSVSLNGKLSLEKELSYDLVLDLFQRLIVKSNTCLGYI